MDKKLGNLRVFKLFYVVFSKVFVIMKNKDVDFSK